MGTESVEQGSGAFGKSAEEYRSFQAQDLVRIEEKPHKRATNGMDYSFRKPVQNIDKITFDERPRDSIERKPASPMTGLDDKMKSIEEKIKKYKEENKQFEKGTCNASDLLPIESQKSDIEKQAMKPVFQTTSNHHLSKATMRTSLNIYLNRFTENILLKSLNLQSCKYLKSI